MCSSNSNPNNTVAHINGRPVLQPTSNQFPRRNSPHNISPKSPAIKPSSSPPISPKLIKSPTPKLNKSKDHRDQLNSSSEYSTIIISKSAGNAILSKSRSFGAVESLPMVASPGTIAAARREQVAMMQEQRKMKIAHYGRTKSAKNFKPVDSSAIVTGADQNKKRCSFITPNSDPIYVAYHDGEWGVPVHDDKQLFELLVLTGAQVGSDWTSVLKKRQVFREAFSEFDPSMVAKFSEHKTVSIAANYGLDISQVRAVVDNAIRILEVKKATGSFNKYLWGFVNHKPMVSQYKSSQKIPVKSSKSESISKDMVRRGFRFVGPTVVYSFMQAAGLINDHLVTCPRHLQCIALASHPPAAAPAL